jgi:spectinomycin phosphotransferase
MLEKPDIPDEVIIAGLQEQYGLQAAGITFLPLGTDVNTAVYRVEAGDGTPYFLKLRQGSFDELSVAVPLFLKQQGIRAIIAPLETRTGQGWGDLGASGKMILHPFIEGGNGFHAELPDRLFIELGEALGAIHAAQVPPELRRLLPRETYSAQWREMVRAFQRRVEGDAFKEPVARELAAFMRAKQEEITRVVERAEELRRGLQRRPLEHVLCHSDLHSGNLLITKDEALYIVDWDNPTLAPRERDLMFINGGIGGALEDRHAEALFYQGYGNVKVDRTALAYYRYERIVQDFAAYCEQLLLTDERGEDRKQGLGYFMSNFLPGNTIEMADKAGSS